mmetsp:Transcript_3588/g.7432  ORF Transcript_3588/g.7432 Transcript_3588/m.7432 type:complete len:103 (-) Transcript_3588:205-513(-)
MPAKAPGRNAVRITKMTIRITGMITVTYVILARICFPNAIEKYVMQQTMNRLNASLGWMGPSPGGLLSKSSNLFSTVPVQYSSELSSQGKGSWHDAAMYGRV